MEEREISVGRILDKILVSGKAMLLTKEYGYVNIASVLNARINVWTGEKYVETSVRQDEQESTVYSVNFNQRFFPQVGRHFNWLVLDDESDIMIVKETQDLKFGDYVIPFKKPKDISETTVDNKIKLNVSYLRVCKVEHLKIKEKLYYLDYTYTDRFMINGVISGIG